LLYSLKSKLKLNGVNMIKYKRMLMMLFASILPVSWAAPCIAAESAFKEIFQDSIYGGLTGSLIGAAVMAFAKRPGNNLEYIGYGAAGGVLAGAAFGALRIAKSVAEMDEKGKVHFAIPAVIPDFNDASSRGPSSYVINAGLLSGKF
jgi:hypothetical protein